MKLFCLDFPFFWDSKVIISAQAIHFYEGGNILNLPVGIDPGHPPLISFLHYLLWSVFGKNLWVSNLVSVPMVAILFYLTSKIGSKIFKHVEYSYLLLGLLFLDPAIFCHLLIASPEIFVLTGFVGALYGVLNGSNRWLVFGAVVMCLSSIRGVMLTASFLPFILYLKKKQSLNQVSLLMVGVASFLVYSLLHYYSQGWAVINPSDNWNQVKVMSGVSGSIKKSFGYIFRNVELGRWLEILGVVFLLFKLKKAWPVAKPLLILFFSGHLIFFAIVVFFDINFGTRYFIPFFYIIHLLFVFLLSMWALKYKGVLAFFVALSLVTGHLWIYNGKISQSWDTTILHTRFYPQWKGALSYMNKNQIDIEKVGGLYPLLRPIDFHFLNGDKRVLKKMDLSLDEHILYTSCSNSYLPEEVKELKENWQILYSQKSGSVETILFKRK